VLEVEFVLELATDGGCDGLVLKVGLVMEVGAVFE
jgi:hypothetical protein